MASQSNNRIKDVGNKNCKDKEVVKTEIFYIRKLPEKIKNDLNKRLESRKTQILNETTEIRNENSWINFRNRAILLNNIGGRLIKQVEAKDNAVEVCEGIYELDESQRPKLEEIVKSKIPELGIELKQTHLRQHKMNFQGHDPTKQRYYHASPKVKKRNK